MQAITDVAGEVLSHIDLYLDKLPDSDYSKPLPLLSDASIGAHTRHILDGFLCLMRQQSGGVISYDKRERDRNIEISTACARQKLDEIRQFILGLDGGGEFEFEVSYADRLFRTSSSMKREIIHNIEHVIHHLAIIKIALLAYHEEIVLPVQFGVAPSTLRYWESRRVKSV
jgi:hypothetical protein